RTLARRLAILEWEITRLDENTDDHRNLLLVDQIVEGCCGVVEESVLTDKDTCGFAGIVLFWNIDPIAAGGAGINFALIPRVLGDLAFGNTGLFNRIRPRYVLGIR